MKKIDTEDSDGQEKSKFVVAASRIMSDVYTELVHRKRLPHLLSVAYSRCYLTFP